MFTRLLSLAMMSCCLLPAFSWCEERHEEDIDQFLVVLSPEKQRLADIRTSRLKPVRPVPARPIPAEVIDPLPLLDIAAQLQQLSAELETARLLLAIASKSKSRLQQLADNVRQEKLLEAQSKQITSKNKAEALEIERSRIRIRLRLYWGKTLARWAENQDPSLQALGNGKIRLLKLTFPIGFQDPCPSQTFVIFSASTPKPLRYLSPAPRTSATPPGQGCFYTAATSSLPIGMRLTAWQTDPVPAIPLPAEAIVWHGGKPWIYIQTSHKTFQRQALSGYRQSANTWWIRTGLDRENRIVVSGSQILLSAELRSQVPEEDDDD